jgi:hypothetical protein
LCASGAWRPNSFEPLERCVRRVARQSGGGRRASKLADIRPRRDDHTIFARWTVESFSEHAASSARLFEWICMTFSMQQKNTGPAAVRRSNCISGKSAARGFGD